VEGKYLMLDAGCWMLDAGYGMLDMGCEKKSRPNRSGSQIFKFSNFQIS